MLDEAAKIGTWGSIEIVLQYGTPVLIHESRTIKLTKGNTSNGQHNRVVETR